MSGCAGVGYASPQPGRQWLTFTTDLILTYYSKLG